MDECTGKFLLILQRCAHRQLIGVGSVLYFQAKWVILWLLRYFIIRKQKGFKRPVVLVST